MILVTGASGWSGSAVIREFARRKTPVRALVRSRARARDLETLPDVELVEGEMRRPDTLEPVLRGVERALIVSSSDPQMLETQCTFIDAAKRAGVRHVVKFSGKESGAGFDAQRFRFTRMHEEIETYLERSGLAWTHLRPSQFMQVYLREAPSIVSKGALPLPLGDARLSPVDLEDIANVAFALLGEEGHEGRIYEMTGPEALTMAEIAERISDAVGKTVRYVNVLPARRREALKPRAAETGTLLIMVEAAGVVRSTSTEPAQVTGTLETRNARLYRKPYRYTGFRLQFHLTAPRLRCRWRPFGVASPKDSRI
jgi:uncharacterized protein YbjT (DUF2867 family)